MGLIHVYNTLDNTHEEIKGTGKLKNIFPDYNFNNCLFLKAGEKVDKNYYVKNDDILYLRVTPAAISATALAIISVTVAVVAAGVAVGVGLAVNKKLNDQQKKAQRDAANLAKQVNQLPFLKGAKNQAALGNMVQYQFGKSYNTPYYLTNVFYTIEGEKGKDQYINMILGCGFGSKRFEKIMLGNEPILENAAGIPAGINNFDASSVYYDAENKIELCHEGNEFTSSKYNYKAVVNDDGAELAHEFGAPVDPSDPDSNGGTPVIRQLPDNVKSLEVCINFNGLRVYNSNNENWEARTVTVKPYWSNDGGATWNEFYFDGVTNNTITANSNTTIRYVAKKEFTAAESFNKSLLLKVVKTTPKLESNSNEDCSLLYYQAFCYDAKKSSSTNLVACKNINEYATQYTDRVALKIKANDNVNGQLDNLHIISTACARVWNGSAWSATKQPTRNPAAIILEILTSEIHSISKYSDDEIDLQSLGALYDYCALNNFYADAVITQKIKKRDMISNILKTISADMIKDNTGLLSFVIDKAEDLPVALLNAENIKTITYAKDFSRKPDGVKVTYTNGENWQVDSFYSMLRGGEKQQGDITTELNIEYVTDYQHAYKMAQKLQRQLIYQNRVITIGVGKEGDYYPLYSTVLVQHKCFKKETISSLITQINKNQYGFITSVKIEEKVKFEAGKVYGAIIEAVTPDGSRVIYRNITGLGATDLISFETPIVSGVMPQLFNNISIGELTEEGEFVKVADVMKITGITPDGNEGFDLELKDYNAAIYEFGAIPAYSSNITNPPAEKPAAAPAVTKADLLNSEVAAIKAAVTAAGKVQPKYIGPFSAAPDLDQYAAGDFYLNTTNGLTYTKTLGAWAEDTGATLTQHLAACMNDLLAIADTLDNEPTFVKNLVAANVFLNNLFAKKIILQTGGEIVSSNFYNEQGEETGNGFKIDYNGDIKANNGFFRGTIANKIYLTGEEYKYIKSSSDNLSFDLLKDISILKDLSIYKYTLFLDLYDSAIGEVEFQNNKVTMIGSFILSSEYILTVVSPFRNENMRYIINGNLNDGFTINESIQYHEGDIYINKTWEKISFTFYDKSMLSNYCRIYAIVEKLNDKE